MFVSQKIIKFYIWVKLRFSLVFLVDKIWIKKLFKDSNKLFSNQLKNVLYHKYV